MTASDGRAAPADWALPGAERPVHFMGVAGVGMTALAELLVRRGVLVTGCDAYAAPPADLIRLGVEIVRGHDPVHAADARAIVVTSAVQRSHPELEEARRLGVPVLRRADALADVIGPAEVIGVAGTHGKTTTTAITTDALVAAGLDPTGITGGRVAAWGGSLWRGGDALFVVEADEYDRSFLALTPAIAVVTNVESDHLDVYDGVAEIRQAFEQFVQPARAIVCCADDPSAAGLRMPTGAEVIRYGLTSAEARLRAVDLRGGGGGGGGGDGAGGWRGTRFEVVYDGKLLGEVRLGMPGRHNVLNALAAIGCGVALGLELGQLLPGIENFAGVERRFQRLGTAAGVAIVDDYAHHPSEIAATLEAARAYFPGARLIAAFQPHLFTRTRDLAADFATALAAADAVFLTEIYPAREIPLPGVSSDLIASGLGRQGRPVVWQGERELLASELAGYVKRGDVVLTLGAGDITRSAYELRELLLAAGGEG